MATTSAAILNRALAHLGQPGTVTVLSTDTTTAGKAGRTFYDPARIETLKAHDWACARKQATLTLVETYTVTDTTEWLYKYRLPEDCLMPRRIVWGVRNPGPDQQYPFRLRADTDSTAWDATVTYETGDYASVTTSGVVVWYRALRETLNDAPASSASDWVAIDGGPPMYLETDRQSAILEYTFDLEDVTQFAQDYEDALCALLAFYIAPIITVNGSATDLQQRAYGAYISLVQQAMSNDWNAKQRDVNPRSTYEGVRSLPRY